VVSIIGQPAERDAAVAAFATMPFIRHELGGGCGSADPDHTSLDDTAGADAHPPTPRRLRRAIPAGRARGRSLPAIAASSSPTTVRPPSAVPVPVPPRPRADGRAMDLHQAGWRRASPR
jgi:hypothetical protein